jgi:hypothetical protein
LRRFNVGKSKSIKISVKLDGITPIMFDRYSGDNKTQLKVEDKFYFGQDGKSLILPSLNVMSFLSAQNTTSVAKRFMPPKEYKRVANGFLSYITITPFEIPICRNGKQIVFEGFSKESGIQIHNSVARLDKGIPNPKIRPVVSAPWDMSFTLNVYENDDFQLKLLEDLFIKGGIALGLGTFRGVFGKFNVSSWDVQ